MTRHIGIDLSLTSPSVCVLAEDDSFKASQFYFLTDVKKLVGTFDNIHGYLHRQWNYDIQRYEQITRWIFDCIHPEMSDKVWLEGYSVNSTKGKIYQIHENTAILKFFFFKYHVTCVTIPPTEIKKKFNGKGNASKEQMYETFLKSSYDIRDTLSLMKKEKIGNPVSDIVDSYACALVGKNYVEKSF